jgi:transcriptional regulator with PAS, ATPase and Fis domain
MINTNLEMSEVEFHTRGTILDKLMETVFDASILVDANGTLLHLANNTDRLRTHPLNKYVGKHITELTTKAHYVMDTLQTQRGHWGVTEMVQGRQCLVNSFPIFDKGKFLGLLSTIHHSSLASLNKIIAQLDGAMNAEDSERTYATISRAGRDLTFDDYVGSSVKVSRLLEQCRRAASVGLPVLLVGESGTGKEILASAIHSTFVDHTWMPFVRINCSAIPKELMESELFGHEKGAFTGAASQKKGKFELASGGSILLDEIGDMDIGLQSKLLRVLEEKEFERVGGTKMLPMTARILSSTNADLRRKIDIGEFRSDLYYRFSAIEIKVPPLREHIEDLPLLVQHFIKRDKLDISPGSAALNALSEHRWPGNVRELRNIINRLGLFCTGERVSAADVYAHIGASAEPNNSLQPEWDKESTTERAQLIDALEHTGFDIRAAAEKLGVCRATVYNRIYRYGIQKRKAEPSQGIEKDSSERAQLIDALESTGFNIPAAAKKLGVCRATVYNMMNRHGIKKEKSS